MFLGTNTTVPQDADFRRIAEHTSSLADSIGIRVYSDTTPKVWRTAQLQKGLILVHHGVEEVGEGTGFGVPVIVSSKETYFSGSSAVYIKNIQESTIIRKEYCMDRLARNVYRNIQLENRQIRSLLARFSELYQASDSSRSPILMLKRVPMRIGVTSSFVKTAPLGRVFVTFNICQNRISVEAEFTSLKQRNLQRIFMMNEQGTRFFRIYQDSSGKQLVDQQIGAWNQIEADWAAIMDAKSNIGFRLRRVENSILRVGRELHEGYLDWIGLDYEVDPKSKMFRYEIEILGV